jgi:hypothetical protein
MEHWLIDDGTASIQCDLSDPRIKRPRRDTPPFALRARRESTGRHVIWGLVPVRAGESCRWQSWDGRWVSLTLGIGPDFGRVLIIDSTGRREFVSSYEDALALAKKWRGDL